MDFLNKTGEKGETCPEWEENFETEFERLSNIFMSETELEHESDHSIRITNFEDETSCEGSLAAEEATSEFDTEPSEMEEIFNDVVSGHRIEPDVLDDVDIDRETESSLKKKYFQDDEQSVPLKINDANFSPKKMAVFLLIFSLVFAGLICLLPYITKPKTCIFPKPPTLFQKVKAFLTRTELVIQCAEDDYLEM